MSTATEYLGMAALLAMRALATTRGLPRSRPQFVEAFTDRYEWTLDEDQAEKAVKQMEAWGYLSLLTDRYAGESLRFTRLSADETMIRYMPDEITQLYEKARLGGVAWFGDVFRNNEFWHDLYAEDTPRPRSDSEVGDEFASLQIPASDRVVSINDNRQSVELISVDLRSLSEELRTNNEVAAELGEERVLIEGEIQAAEKLLDQPAFRLQRLHLLILPALRFLAEKFAAGAIGELAKRLIVLLFGLS